jgi:RNA polymerase sigma factor (sigma-70 family)
VGFSEAGKSDADLVHEALAGDKEPLAELLRRHWDTAVFLAARVLGSAELAGDAAQEAAIAVLTDLDRLRSPDRFGAWFCGIALNVSRRWLRQLRSEVPGLPDRVSELPGPAETAEAADISGRVHRAVAALPDGQRQAVLLFYLQGLSHREVAADLGISVGAVKARLHQARAALAPKLAQITDIPEVATVTMTDATEWIDATVTEIRRSQGEDPWPPWHIMILHERGGERRLPISIGPAEASALALILESVEFPRPSTYKLALSLAEAAGARIKEIRITRLLDQVFYACVVIQGPGGRREVDARPSDAVTLAQAIGAPIRVDSQLLDPAATAGHLEDSVSYPVATADIAAETQQRFRDQLRRHERRPGHDQPGSKV